MNRASEFWPTAIQGAISLTFDDNTLSQLNNALPCLDNCGLKGTFYVNPGRSTAWEENLARWQQASRNGHEIGNHTADHPCSCNFGFRKDGYCLEELALTDIEQTIDQCTVALDDHFPEQGGNRSFCYPCYQSYVGAGTHRQSYVPVVAKRFKAARGRGERPNDPRVIDLSYIWSFAVERHSGADMIAYAEGAITQGHWGVICMHGVGGDHLAVATNALRELCSYLDYNRDRIWTDTLINVANYIGERRASSP